MKLLDDIIALLSDERPVLADALIKTKVLLHGLGRKDLTEWVNFELNGYPEDATLPSYRIISTEVRGAVTNGVYFYRDHPLPVLHLNEQIRERYQRLQLRQSIAAVEELAATGEKGLTSPIPVELNALFNRALGQGYQVQRAWCDIGVGQLTEIKTQVRSRLLDFLLELREKIGSEPTTEELKRVGQSPETASMFNHAIFGDNVTILVGNNSAQTVSNRVSRNDFESLATYLRASNVSVDDINELKAAITDDATTSEVATNQFGPGVRNWMKAMLAKAVDTSWQIELGIASNLLTEAIKAFYGW